MNDGGVCRTAPATPGLLIIEPKDHYSWNKDCLNKGCWIQGCWIWGLLNMRSLFPRFVLHSTRGSSPYFTTITRTRQDTSRLMFTQSTEPRSPPINLACRELLEYTVLFCTAPYYMHSWQWRGLYSTSTGVHCDLHTVTSWPLWSLLSAGAGSHGGGKCTLTRQLDRVYIVVY